MLCPRCTSDNDSARASCWNCLAPLQGAAAARVKPMTLTGKGAAPAAPAAEQTMTGEPAAPAESAAPAKKRGLFGLGGKK